MTVAIWSDEQLKQIEELAKIEGQWRPWWGGEEDTPDKCVCDIKLLMDRGCQCGGAKKELAKEKEKANAKD